MSNKQTSSQRSPNKRIETAEYNKSYYRLHKDEIQNRRKQRYQTDPNYREVARERARTYFDTVGKDKRKKLQEINKIVRGKERKPRPPKMMLLLIDGEAQNVLCYSSGALAKILNRSPVTMKKWEEKGYLPPATFRDTFNRRLYTRDQVEEIASVVTGFIKKFGGVFLNDDFKVALNIAWNRVKTGVKK